MNVYNLPAPFWLEVSLYKYTAVNGGPFEDCTKMVNHLVCEGTAVLRAYLGYGSDEVERGRKRKVKPSPLPFGIQLPGTLKRKRRAGPRKETLQQNDILPDSQRDEGADFQFEEEKDGACPGEEPNDDENLLNHLLHECLGSLLHATVYYMLLY